MAAVSTAGFDIVTSDRSLGRNMPQRIGRILGWGAVVLALMGLLGCEARSPLRIRPGPVVKVRRTGTTAKALEKVAVIPFYPAQRLRGDTGITPAAGTTPSGWESATMVANFVGHALAEQGLIVIQANDVELAFTGEGRPVPRMDPRAAADQASRSFGASSVLLGQVIRYRDRDGSAMGSEQSASVAFEVTLYEAPSARKLWTGRFDETQKTLTGDFLRAHNYPGGGTRWLSAAEFARWGAEETAKALTAGP